MILQDLGYELMNICHFGPWQQEICVVLLKTFFELVINKTLFHYGLWIDFILLVRDITWLNVRDWAASNFSAVWTATVGLRGTI